MGVTYLFTIMDQKTIDLSAAGAARSVARWGTAEAVPFPDFVTVCISHLILRRFRKPPKETILLPLRTLRIVCDFHHQLPDDVFILASRGEVDRLVQIEASSASPRAW